MTTQNKNVPALRFPDFNGDWQEQNLGEVTDYTKGFAFKSADYLTEGSRIVRVSDLTARSIKTDNEKIFIANEKVKLYEKYNLEKGNIIITTVGSKPDLLESAVGRGIFIRKENEGLLNQNMLKFNNIKNIDNGFLFGYINSEKYISHIKDIQRGNANQSNITVSDLLEYKVFIPTLPEQQKIAAFLTVVDEKIQQLAKKKELLEQYKKGVMQKIFNQEIRFKDDNGNDFADWEEKKLEQIISRFIVPMRDKPTDLTGSIPWCRIEDFDGKFLYKSKSNQGVSENTVKSMNLKIYPINTLLVSCSANLGFCAITKNKLVTNQTFIGLVPMVNKINVEFLYYVMKLSSRKLNTLSSGTTISYLSREQFEKFKISIPCIAEQNKIADFLSALDGKINSVNQQLEKTKEYKKGLLQQMFV